MKAVEIENKVRCDAIIKRLPEKKQVVLLEYWRTHSAKQTIKWLADDDIKTSVRALSLWRAWYVARERNKAREERILSILADHKKRDPSLTNEKLTEVGELLFNAIAIDQEDAKTWSIAQQLQIKRGALAVQKSKLALEFKKFKNQIEAARETNDDPKMSPEEKQSRIRELLGTE
jgi:hypothetical protein